jgi:putative ABC transport system permease protein
MIRAADVVAQATRAITAHRLRTLLILLAMAIGVAAVILLTALGESARRYVTGEFASLGTNLVIVLPGRSETVGGPPPLLGETPRDLTLDDALALTRSPHITKVAPLMVGAAPVSYGGLERDVNVMGSTAAMREVRHLTMAQGRFLPDIDPRAAAPACVLGDVIYRELFPDGGALGEWLRVGDRRFRVVGVLAAEGSSIGVDFDEVVIIPVASAQTLFNQESLFRILAEATTPAVMRRAADDVHRIIAERHEGEDDVTVITQDSVLATFDEIFRALTAAVGGIAGVSLAVAGILIMNIMLVAVTQRTAEIGLLKALGATAREIRNLFLAEAVLLSGGGGLLGLGIGLTSAWLLDRIYPVVDIAPPPWAVIAAVAVAVLTGLAFGVAPALRAARLDPVAALARR